MLIITLDVIIKTNILSSVRKQWCYIKFLK